MSFNPYKPAANDIARRLASFAEADSKVPSLEEAKKLVAEEEARQRDEAHEYGAGRLIALTNATKRERKRAGR